PTWEGHVFEMFLFDEALNGCVPGAATQPTVQCFGKTVSADFNGDGLCNGLFQIDLDCDQVAEDPNTGDFVKKGQATPSNLPWDAGAVLSDSTKTGYKSADETAANARNIFTYVNGAKTAFTAANASTLLPLMNISSAWCSSFLTQIGVTAGSNPTLQCAQNLIYFVRGWDVLDQDTDGCKGPGQTNPSTCPSGIKGEERNRANDNNTTPFFWKLGDIFHSSPGVVLVPSDEIRCLTTYDKQCNATLFSPPGYPSGTQTAIVGYTDSNGNPVDAYAKYRLNNIHRQRVLLVGANDGMLHAFDAGAPDTTQPADITGEYPYTIGTGSELWAFLPPDMLPRLKDLIGAHQYMVDGSVMLRDVWVDGSGSQVSSKDFKKQSDEYHTVAIFGRRAGGAAYSALDVTNPTSPVLLWSFPQGCSDDARYMGESWAEFAPRPPPIFPVRLNNPSSPLKDSPSGTFYEERWVVMLNGGYDPMLAKGRAVFMLDAWTGTTLWRFTDADFKQQLGYGSGTSMFPVTSAIEGVDIGDPTKQSIDGDGFIDTATWADLGGQLWLARFYTPGVIDKATGRVNNWFAARAFEQQRRTDDLQYVAGRNEFFFMPDNIYDAASHTLHTYLGSGNREQIMGQAASCGTDNMLACCQGGCTNVTATTTDNYGACNLTTTFSCVNGAYSYATSTTASCGTTSTPSTTSETCAAAPGNAYTSSLNAHWVCPGAGTVADQPGSASCDGSGLCTITPMAQRNISGTYNAPSHNRFYGIWSFGGDPKKMFDTPSVPGSDTAAAALIFDQNRFTDVSYPAACGGPAGKSCTLVNTTTAKVTASASNSMLLTTSCGTGVTKCSATSTDPGWFYEYGDVCPLSGCTTSPPWTDEKTGSEATTLVGCVMWGSFRPVGATTSTSPCSGTLGVPAAYSYGAHYMAGTMNPNVCGLSTLAVASAITSPPNAAIPMIDVGGGGGQSGGSPPSGPPKPFGTTQTGCSGGSISYGAASFNPGSGSSKTIVHQSSCANEPVYWLEVPRDLHSCRHVAPAAGSSNCE
ncbi:MAG TPA: hypothetical protein VML50_04120, partial [Anaeromyxobacter sp.]|nr:hypothetical protein [Anaeromyxobacter sp.]